ncbi:Cytochrome c6, chloroplastic [Zea mays]|uniref:Cytochrome c-553 n=1 Tax=Zea mays TaxID=4577 RepID=A0A3L6E0J3_MAIZE|nr:Cytochrome c6, chloroplastic [Zea mays]
MSGLPPAARPLLPSPCASSSVVRAKAASACCSSLKQSRPGRSAAAPSAVAARQAAPLLAAALLLVAAPPGLPAAISPAFAQPVSEGAALFRKACIGCHDMGGNILQPGFGEKCTPRGQCTFGPRLSEDDIKILASFVKSQAQNGWPKIEGDGD